MMIKTGKELFYMAKELDDVFKSNLKGIVQNQHSICEGEIDEWNENVKKLERKLDKAYEEQKSKILELYLEMNMYYRKQEKTNEDS